MAKGDITIKHEVVGQEATLRIGEPLPLREPNKVGILGTVTAPHAYIEKRLGNYKVDLCVVMVDTDNGTVELVINEKDAYKDSIKGSLSPHKDLTALKINTDQTFSPNDLARLLKRYKFYFKHPTEHEKFLIALTNFTADISTKIKAARDTKGNSLASIERTVLNSVDLPRFTLDIPIFKGCPKKVFQVEICVDSTDSDLRYYLESLELFQIQEDEKHNLLQQEITKFTQDGFTVVLLT